MANWNLTSYSGENLTLNYGVVENLDGSSNISYPILITVAADLKSSPNGTVNCALTAGSTTENFSFFIVPSEVQVIL